MCKWLFEDIHFLFVGVQKMLQYNLLQWPEHGLYLHCSSWKRIKYGHVVPCFNSTGCSNGFFFTLGQPLLAELKI